MLWGILPDWRCDGEHVKAIFGLASICITALAFADEPVTTLKVQPRLCIIDERTPYCDVKFDIKWRSSKAGEYCVKAEQDTEPLRCWADVEAGDVDDKRKVTKTFSYELKEEEEIRTTTKVEVLRMDSDDRRRRRRTRHVWDVL